MNKKTFFNRLNHKQDIAYEEIQTEYIGHAMIASGFYPDFIPASCVLVVCGIMRIHVEAARGTPFFNVSEQ